MKRQILAALVAASLAVSPAAVYAAEPQTETAESSGTQILARVDASDGACGLFGGMAYNGNLFLLLAYQNKGSNNNYPATAFNVQAFQDGVALPMAVTLDKPNGFESSTTLVQPGTTIAYYQAYQFRNDSPVEVEISAVLDLARANVATYTFQYADLFGGETPEAESTAAEDWEGKYNELLEHYRLLEEKYNALLEAQTEAE